MYLLKPVDFLKPDNCIWLVATFATNEIDLVKRWQQYLE